MKTIIIAAGTGSRIGNERETLPKTLLPYGDGTLLTTIMDNFSQVGVSEFIVVVGFRAADIKKYVREHRGFGHRVRFVENPDWRRGNGISVLVTEPLVSGEDFLLTMSDHIVPVDALARIAEYKSGNSLLLVDPHPEAVFDKADATKVATDGECIVRIGKELESYDGVDCGIFRLNFAFFEAMREALKSNYDSITSAAGILARDRSLEAVYLEPGETWIDIDTPEAYQHALDRIKSPSRYPS